MSNHDELIERLRASAAAMPFDAAVAVQYRAAADALEAQAQAGAVPLTLRWCAHCGEGVTNFCRSKPAGDCPIGLPRIKGGQHVGKVD